MVGIDSLTPEQIHSVILRVRSNVKQNRINSIKNLAAISKKMGVERTVEELVPYYIESTNLSAEDIAMILDQIQLFDFSDYSTENFNQLLKAIKEFAEIETPCVRDSFASLMSILADKFDDDQFESIFLPYFLKMLDDDYQPILITFFTILKSVASILPTETISDIMTQFQGIEEIAPITQVYFIKSAAELCKHANEETVETILATLEEFLENKDPQIALAILSILSELEIDREKTDSFIKAIISIQDSRVQLKLIDTIKNLPQINPDDIVDYLKYYYQKKNKILNVAIADALPSCHGSSDQTLSALRDLVDELLQSDFQSVIVSTLKALYPLVDELGYHYVLDYLRQFIASSTVDLQLAAVSTILESNFKDDEKFSLIESLIEKIDWHGRYSIAASTAMMSNESLLERFLVDDSVKVREVAARSTGALIKEKGDEFQNDFVIPTVYKMLKDENYQIRQSAIQLALEVNNKTLASDVVSKAANDEISNVRISAMKAAKLLGLDDVIEKLSNDPDEDVCDAE